jgi:hypothetical protein
VMVVAVDVAGVEHCLPDSFVEVKPLGKVGTGV